MPTRPALALLAAAAVVGACVTVAGATEPTDRPTRWMSGDDIRSRFSGRALAGHYPSGALWSEHIFTDGSTDYREGAKHWRGNWWLTGLEFCFAYPPPGVGGCFRVVRMSANCYELYDFSTAAGQGATPPDGENRWNGRMWISDEPTTCEERPAV